MTSRPKRNLVAGSQSDLLRIARRAGNAVPLGFLAVAFGSVAVGLPAIAGLESRWLSRLFMLEFLAIHSYPFMMLLLMWRAPDDKTKGLRAFLVLALAFLYSLGAYKIGDWPGVLALGTLMVGTYFGLLLRGVSISLKPELITRGALNFIAFVGTSMVFDLPSNVDQWTGDSDTVSAGFAYFAILAAMEAGGSYRTIAARFTPKEQRDKHRDDSEGLELPASLDGLRAATLPLWNSFGLAITPYIVLPIVAGIGGRILDEMFEYPLGYDIIRYWYFILFVTTLGLVRSWQIRRVLSAGGKKKFAVVTGVVWILFGIAGAFSFLSVDYVSFVALWSLDNAVAIVVLDALLNFVLVPAVWAQSRSPGASGGAS